jgi:hypothetical protein
MATIEQMSMVPKSVTVQVVMEDGRVLQWDMRQVSDLSLEEVPEGQEPSFLIHLERFSRSPDYCNMTFRMKAFPHNETGNYYRLTEVPPQ